MAGRDDVAATTFASQVDALVGMDSAGGFRLELAEILYLCVTQPGAALDDIEDRAAAQLEVSFASA